MNHVTFLPPRMIPMTGTTEMLSSCSEQKYNSKMQDCCKKGRKDEIQNIVPVNKFILKRSQRCCWWLHIRALKL